ncbi:MAG: hypothetical protein PF517_01600 [Salinivirgaceae bacterium]|jgi:hypothetical protein|nr:hypothetical protein [Salinivirgaceae bacterium]
MLTVIKTYNNETKEKLKIKFPMLTDEDLYFREGREKEMMEMLANKLNMSYRDLINTIETL